MEWRDELIEKLERVNNLAIDADTFLSAFEAVYGETTWPRGNDPDRRRALNRMSCFVAQLRSVLDELLRESQLAVKLAMRRQS